MNRRQYEACRRLSADPGATPDERDTALRRCHEYEQRRGTQCLIPWYQLKVCVKDGPRAGRWLGNTSEFRAVLRYVKAMGIGSMNGCYMAHADSASAIADFLVDWTFFPEYESASTRWRPPVEMRAKIKSARLPQGRRLSNKKAA